MAFSVTQQRALAMAPRLSAVLSMFGSGCMIRGILCDHSKLRNTYNRILLAMSIVDVTASFWYALSTWAVPKGSPGIWGASGNVVTCTIQGFFVQSSCWIPALNASLAIYCLLVGRYKWTQEKIRSLDPLLIGGPLIMGYGTGVAGIALKLYNNANIWCWIAPFPQNCKDSFRYGEAGDCVRGDNAWIYRWAFTYAHVWWCIILATASMLVVYWTVLQQERAVDRFQEGGLTLRKQSKRVAQQGLWYIIAFYITWVPATLVRLFQTTPNTTHLVKYPIILLMAVCLPLQGFLNFMVYSRAKFRKYHREHPSATTWEATKAAVFSIVPATRRLNETPLEGDSIPPSNPLNRVPTEAILQETAFSIVQVTEKKHKLMTKRNSIKGASSRERVATAGVLDRQ